MNIPVSDRALSGQNTSGQNTSVGTAQPSQPGWRWPLRGLYAITPDDADTESLLQRVEVVLRVGVSCLQYRNKSAGDAMRAAQASALQALCSVHHVPLIINDDWRLAAATGAAGVHLGQDDAALPDARAALGEGAIIGASCHDNAQLARRAVAQGASYVAFGAFFPSPTKPGARRATLDLLHGMSELPVPVVAIGGITPDNARPLIRSGADLIAVISGIFDAPDPAAATRAYLSCFQATDP